MPSIKPTPEQFDTAIAWLEVNEEDGAEGLACKAVANWLIEKANADDLRSAARRGGVSVAALRQRLAKSPPVPALLAEKWAKKIGMGFNIDTPAADYEPALSAADAAEYAADVELITSRCENPHEVVMRAIKRMQQQG